MTDLVAAAMTAVGYTILTLIVSSVRAHLPLPLAPLLAFVFTHQAGWLVNALAQYTLLGGRAVLAVPCSLLVPVVGLLNKVRAPPVLLPTKPPGRAQAGADIVEALFYVLVGSASFGWNSVAGWPVAVLGMLAAILARPWIAVRL